MVVRQIHRLYTITFGLLLLFCVLIPMGASDTFGKSPDDFTINLLGVYANAEPELILYQDFEAGWYGWYSDNGVWEVGTHWAGTNLDGKYPYTTDSRLVSPSVQLPEVTEDEEILLRFWQWFSYASDDTGSVQIQIYDGTVWQSWMQVEMLADEDSGGWSFACVDLTAYAGQRVRIGFYHEDETETSSLYGNIHSESSGWYIDEVEIIKQDVPQFSGFEDFESGWGDWHASNGVWQVGEPNSGPGAAHQGNCLVGTVLDGKYPYVTESRLISPSVQLWGVPPGEEVMLCFWQWFSYASWDSGWVQIQVHDETDWQPWTTLETRANGVSGGWSFTCVDLTAYAGQRVRIGFYHDDDTETSSLYGNIHSESSGWYIDEVEIVPRPGCTLAVSAIGRGSITDPNLENNSYPCGQEVAVTAVADPNFEFVRWEGTAVDANKTVIEYQDLFGSKIWVTVDDAYTLRAIFEEVVYDFSLDSNPGWAMNGQWEFGTPKGNGCEYGNPDPTSGHTGRNVIGVNLNGCYDTAIGGPYLVVAGPFDMRNYRDVNLRFWEWLNTDWSDYVKHSLEISLDGGTWELVWQNPERMDITDDSWNLVEYDISSLADGQPSVYLRWTYQVLRERAYPYTGWNIDDVQWIGHR